MSPQAALVLALVAIVILAGLVLWLVVRLVTRHAPDEEPMEHFKPRQPDGSPDESWRRNVL